MTWTQPMCTNCWVIEYGGPTSQPVRMRPSTWHDDLQVCCQCGTVTTSGIFVRRDPAAVRFPAEDRP